MGEGEDYAHRLNLRNPSAWVMASLRAFEMWGWIHFHPDTDHQEPPLVPEASR